MRRFVGSIAALAASLAWGVVLAQSSPVPNIAPVKVPTANLRAGKGTEYQILAELRQGDSLQVTGLDGEWVQVKLPDTVALFVSSRYVDPEGTVTAGRLNVRPRPSTQFQAMGQVAKGTRLRVLQQQDGWTAIAPPEGFFGWVHARLLDLAAVSPALAVAPAAPAREGGRATAPDRTGDAGRRATAATPVAVPAPPPAVDPQRTAFDKALKLYTAEIAKGLGQADIGPVIRLLEQVVAQANDVALAQSARAALARCTRVREIQAEYRRAQAGVERAMESGDRARAAADAAPAGTASGRPDATTRPAAAVRVPDESSFASVGWVEGLGKFFGRPGTHALVKGGQVVAWLRVDADSALNLNRYAGKRVGIRGPVTGERYEDLPIYRVQEVFILAER